MRAFTSIVLALSAAFAVAQNSTMPNAFNIPPNQSSFNVAAGGTVDLTWEHPQGSTVTIKLQQNSNNITPDSGVVLAQSIPNTGSTTVTIPAGSDIPANGAYTFEIIDDSDAGTINFSPPFQVSGAAGTGTFAASTATSTGSATSSSTGMTTTTGSTTSSSTSASSTTTSSSAASSTSASMTSSTAVPNSNAGVKAQAPLAAAVILGAAAFL